MLVDVNELKDDVKELAVILSNTGHDIINVLEGDINYDPCIDIENGYSIVISNDGFYCLTKGYGSTLEYIIESEDIYDILYNIKECV